MHVPGHGEYMHVERMYSPIQSLSHSGYSSIYSTYGIHIVISRKCMCYYDMNPFTMLPFKTKKKTKQKIRFLHKVLNRNLVEMVTWMWVDCWNVTVHDEKKKKRKLSSVVSISWQQRWVYSVNISWFIICYVKCWKTKIPQSRLLQMSHIFE